MGKIILEEQTETSTPASNKVAIYPKAGGDVYKKADDGNERQLITKTEVETLITDQGIVAHLDGGDAASTYGFAVTDGDDAAISTFTANFNGGNSTTF